MSALIGVMGVAVLFVVFGLTCNRSQGHVCGNCHDATCDGCELSQQWRKSR